MNAHHRDRSAAAAIFANGTYFLDNPRTSSGTVRHVHAVLEAVNFVHGILASLHVHEYII